MTSNRPNPDPRNSETISATRPKNSEANSAVRRSFSGNPFAKLTNPRSFNPSNSPSDHVKRHLSGRDGSRFHEEKENESKFEKVRSKNFMSSTISAASKFTPSPRKKVLSERNRASMDFDPPKSEHLSDDQNMIISEFPRKVDGSNDVKINHKRVRFEEEHPVSEVTVHKKDELKLSEAILSHTTDSVVLDLTPKNEPSPIIHADPDPSFSAYDPKTNYLSPRPRFLRYKPNPRIQLLLNKELEDGSIPSEDSSETQSEDDLNRESEDLSSVEPNSEEERDPVVTYEPVVVSTPEQVLEAKISRRSWSFRSLFLAILIASVSLISLKYSPIMVKDVGFTKVYDPSIKFAEFAKANLDRFNQWSLDLSDLKLYLTGAHNLGPIKFMNLTSTPQEEFSVDPWIKENLDYNKLGKISEQEKEDFMEDVNAVIGEEELEREDDVEVDESSRGKEPDKDREGDEGMQLESSVVGSTRKETDKESFEAESVIEGLEIDDDIHVRTNSEDGLVLISNILDREPEESQVKFEAGLEIDDDIHVRANSEDGLVLDREPEEIELAEVETELSDLISKPELLEEITESEVVADNGPANMFLSVPNVIALLCMVLLATIFIYLSLRKGKISIANVVDPLLPPNKQVQKQVSHNCGTEVDHLAGESYTVSNSQNTITSYSKGTGGGDNTSEAQSRETTRPRRNYNKRESMASSSSDFSMSPSYGSFTTYEKIPIKHASGEEEILTPIRRSSRLVSKKHVTSL